MAVLTHATPGGYGIVSASVSCGELSRRVFDDIANASQVWRRQLEVPRLLGEAVATRSKFNEPVNFEFDYGQVDIVKFVDAPEDNFDW